MSRETLKQARKIQKMTQQAMADKVPMDLGYYKKIESGERLGSIAIWDALEDILGINQRKLRLISSIHPCKEGNLQTHLVCLQTLLTSQKMVVDHRFHTSDKNEALHQHSQPSAVQ